MEQNQEELNSTKLEEPKSINLEELANCSPEEQIAKLKVALSEAETRAKREGIRADLNEEIIKIAESKFNIQIRKKAGAKQ